MKALFDPAGFPLAFFDPALGGAIPELVVDITEAQWRELIEHAGARRWDGADVVPYAPEPEPLDLSAYARQRRWEIETGGIVVAGASIRTDEQSQAKISGAVQLLDKDPTLTEIDWEAQEGEWVTVDAAMMQAIGIAVGRHVQTCFSALRDVQAGIAGGTLTTTAQIDAAFAAATTT